MTTLMLACREKALYSADEFSLAQEFLSTKKKNTYTTKNHGESSAGSQKKSDFIIFSQVILKIRRSEKKNTQKIRKLNRWRWWNIIRNRARLCTQIVRSINRKWQHIIKCCIKFMARFDSKLHNNWQKRSKQTVDSWSSLTSASRPDFPFRTPKMVILNGRKTPRSPNGIR